MIAAERWNVKPYRGEQGPARDFCNKLNGPRPIVAQNDGQGPFAKEEKKRCPSRRTRFQQVARESPHSLSTAPSASSDSVSS